MPGQKKPGGPNVALRLGWISWTFLWFCDPGCCVTNCIDTRPISTPEPPRSLGNPTCTWWGKC